MQRNCFLAILSLIWFFMTTGFASKPNSLGIQLSVDRKELSNGLNVILAVDHSSPIVSFQTWFRVGSVDELPGVTGISHMFEHLMFKGTPKYGPKQFFNELEVRGAEVNAFTTRDATVFYENFVPSLLEKVIEMESDRMANLILNEATLNSERLVILEERRLRTENNPRGRMHEALWQMAFHRHPYQWPVIGYPQDLLSISISQLKQFYQKYYQPGNATVVVVGNIDPEQTYSWIKKHYGKVPGQGVVTRKVALEPEQREERRLILRDKVASEEFLQGYHISSADQADSHALDVLANVLFSGTTSRAHKRLVEEKELVLGISGMAYTPAYPGLFIITAVMKSQIEGGRVEAELARLFRDIEEIPISSDEIAMAVKKLWVERMDAIRTPFGLGQLLGSTQVILGNSERFLDDITQYSKINVNDLRRVANKYFYPNNRTVVTLVPK